MNLRKLLAYTGVSLALALGSGSVHAQDKPQVQGSSKSERISLEDRLLADAKKDKFFDAYAKDKEYLLVTDSSGISVICNNKEAKVFRRDNVSSDVASAIRRIYQPSKFIRPDFFVTNYNFNNSLDNSFVDNLNDSLPASLKQSSDDIKKVRTNLDKAGPNSKSFLAALDLLSKDKVDAFEKVSSALWYISQMDGAGYVEVVDGSPKLTRPDLQVMDAATFYENIHYAFRSREFPWAKSIPKEDFLQNIISARVTQEPLSDTRRLRYEALKPFMDKMKDAGEAVSFLNRLVNATVNFQQTGFEDFSPTLRLASHVGRCEDQTNELIDYAKAVGIAGFHMGVSAHAKADGNHTWFGMKVTDSSGASSYFSVNSGYPSDSDPKAFNGLVAAKIRASTPFGKRTDITDKFTHASPLTFSGKDFYSPQDSGSFFLNVLNFGLPVSVAQAPFNNGVDFGFTGNKTGILYVVSKNQRNWNNPGPLEQVADPFVFEEDGSRVYLNGNPSGVVASYDLRKDVLIENVNDLVEKHQSGSVGSEGSCVVMYWDSKKGFWDDSKGQQGKIIVDVNGEYHVPNISLSSNVLYQAFKNDGNRIGRPFSVINGKLRSL